MPPPLRSTIDACLLSAQPPIISCVCLYVGEGKYTLETTRADKSVWLMKCPPVVTQSWEAASAASALSGSGDPTKNPIVAKVVLSLDLLNPDESSAAVKMEMAQTESSYTPKSLIKGQTSEWVTVEYYHPNPSEDDWIGVFSPANFRSVYMFDHRPLALIPKANHRITTTLQRQLYGHITTAEIRPLNEEKAVQAAVDLIGELFVFSVVGGLVIFEVQRSARSEARKEEKRRQEIAGVVKVTLILGRKKARRKLDIFRSYVLRGS